MKELFIKLWDNLVNLGIHDDLEESQKIKIKLINKLGVVGFFASLVLVFIVRLYLGMGSPFSSLGTIGLIAIAMCFQYHRKYQITSHFLCILYPTYIAYRINFSGQSTAYLSMLLVVALMIFILYEETPKLKIISFAYVLMIGVGSYSYSIIDPIQITFEESYTIHISAFISTLIVLCSIVYFYQQGIFKYENDNSLLFDELKNKNDELERFAYVTSHDLKEPVRNIGSLAKVLESNIDKSGYDEKNNEIINLIEVSSIRMSALIDSILDFSKIEAQDFYSEEVSIAEIVEEFISSHEQLISARNAQINHSNLSVINGNKVFLSLLFQNLIKNSITYNEDKQPTINITGSNKGLTKEIVVSDNGVGIDEEYHSYIFEPFKKLASDTLFQGSGLGLSICKRVMEHHVGTISVISNRNVGSKFILSFPSN